MHCGVLNRKAIQKERGVCVCVWMTHFVGCVCVCVCMDDSFCCTVNTKETILQ